MRSKAHTIKCYLKESKTRVNTEYGLDDKVTGHYFDLPEVLNEDIITAFQEMARPAHDDTIRGKLLELSVLKRIDGGEIRIKMVVDSLVKDCSGFSEWAIIEACEHYRKKDTPFFPDVGEYFQYAKMLDRRYRRALDDINNPKPKPKVEEPPPPPTFKQSFRVRNMMKIAKKHPDAVTARETWWLNTLKNQKSGG